MLTRTLAFLFGVLLCQQLPALPPAWSALSLLLPPLLWPVQRWLAQILALLLLGFFWAVMVAQLALHDRLPAELEGEQLTLQGVVSSLPQGDARHRRFLFDSKTLKQEGKEAVPWARHLRLSWYQGAPGLVPGQQWQLVVKLKRPRGMMNPAGLDYEQWLFQQGIDATGYVRSSPLNLLLDADPEGVYLDYSRYRLMQRLDQALAGEPLGGIIKALAIGERSGIDDGQWALLLQTGTNHLVAISGLHVGLVAGLIYLVVSWLWRHCPGCTLRFPAPRAAAVAAALAALVYAALAGFSVPTQRALLMLTLVMAAIFLQRPLHPARIFSLALLLVLLHDPLVVLSAGFWLSFAAVGLILYGMGGRLNPVGMWWRWGRVQWLVALGLSPLLLLMFGQASLVAPLANLVAVPVVGLVIVPLTLLGTVILGWWGWGGESLLQLATTILGWLWPLLELFATLSPPWQTAAAPWWAYLLALPGVAWLLAPRGWPLRWTGILPLLPLLLWRPEPLPPGQVRFTLLDVGQGLAAVVETRHHLAVFDTGPRFPSGFNTGGAVVVPYLRHQGHAVIDTLIISHGDTDHIGGAREVSETLPVGRVLTSVPDKMGWIAHEPCRRGEGWQWDGVQFEFLHPQRMNDGGRGNNGSCVLQVRAGGDVLLLTGDIEEETERELVALYGEALHSDVLVAPHHGSNTSSSEPFIAAVSPRMVLLPLGYRNRYHFPHLEVVARYRHHGVKMLSSSDSGAITLLLGAERPLQAREQRKAARRYWHATDL